MMKKIFCTLLFLVFICCGCGKKEAVNDDLALITKRDKLIIGVRDDAAPFGFRDSKGNLAGYDIDLSKIIAQAILGDENKVEFVPVTATNRIMKLSSGEVDMLIATMSITNQRQQILDFSIPYYIAGQAIMVRQEARRLVLKTLMAKK